MTSAPRGLLDSRTLLLDHLDGLASGEVGIVGNEDHDGGYHCGRDRVDASDDYSVIESSRDRLGLTNLASALDVGTFRHTVAGKTHDLRTFSAWLVAQCRANAADTRDIREVIYSLDGQTVRRWDRLQRRSTGDSSHLSHTHISLFRDATKAGRGLTPLFTRYLTEIGILEADMALDATDINNIKNGVVAGINQRFGIPVDVGAWGALVTSLADAEVREVARDAAQTALIQTVLEAAGNPLSTEQFEQALAAMREAAAEAGASASAVLQERLAAAAQAEADALVDDEPGTPA